jgi:hypothetical protein
MAMDLKDKSVVVSLLHPGITKTNLLKLVGEAPPDAVEAEEAARKLWGIFKSKDIADTGKFWHREGYELPW